MLIALVSSEAFPLGLQMVILSPSPHIAFLPYIHIPGVCPHKDTSPMDEGTTLSPYLILITSLKALFQNEVTSGVREEHVNLGGTRCNP